MSSTFPARSGNQAAIRKAQILAGERRAAWFAQHTASLATRYAPTSPDQPEPGLLPRLRELGQECGNAKGPE